MSNETRKSDPSAIAVNNAVAELLSHLSGKEQFKGLNTLFAGYLRSDFSNMKEDRMEATYTYECFRDLSLSLMALENENRQALLDNLRNPKS